MSAAAERQQQPLLIVEDDLALQKQLKWSLDRFESVVADDVPSALLQFRRHGPAVVTMDLGLPPDRDSVSEGFRCLEKMLELDPAAKVIVLTGQNDQENALRAVRMGAYDFLAKPFEPEVLGLIVQRALRLHELQAENERLVAMRQPDSLSGLLTRNDLMVALQGAVPDALPVGEIVRRPVITILPTATLHEAIAKLLKHDIGRMPVVSPDHPRRVIGYLGRADILAARTRLHDEEETREHGPWRSSKTAKA